MRLWSRLLNKRYLEAPNAALGAAFAGVPRRPALQYSTRAYIAGGALLSAAGLIGGAAAGAIVGATAHFAADRARPEAMIAVGLSVIVVLVLDLAGVRIRLVQRDVETPKEWLDQGRVSWALKTGATLGSGIFTRVGFWSWYMLPISAAATAEWWRGAIVCGLYGLVRTSGSVMVGLPRFGAPRLSAVDPRTLLAARHAARRVSNLAGVLVALVIIVGDKGGP